MNFQFSMAERKQTKDAYFLFSLKIDYLNPPRLIENFKLKIEN